MFYLQVQPDGIITDAISYQAPGYILCDISYVPPGVNGGWYKLVNGEIIEFPELKTPTTDEQLAQLKADNLILMDVLATMYEDMLAKGTV